MIKQAALFFLIATVFVACNPKGDTAHSSADKATPLKIIVEKYYEDRLKLFPLEATQIADPRYNNLLPNDISESVRKEQYAFFKKYLDEINGFTRDSLDDNDKITYDVFKHEMTINLEGFNFHDNYIPFNQFWGLPLTFAELGSGKSYQPFKTVKDYDDFLERIHAFTVWSDTAIANFKKGIESGIILPKTLVIKMIPQLENLTTADSKKNIFFQPLASFPEAFSAQDKERLTAAYNTAITSEIIPAYKKLASFLKNDYLPKARNTSGISDIPGGKERYAYLIRLWTTTNLSADSVYAIGLSEVARIRKEMDNVKNVVGFKGELKVFLEQCRTDKKLMPFKTDTAIINFFANIEKSVLSKVDKYFGRFPKTKFEIRQTEAFRAASASPEYSQGAPDGSRPGIFYIPIVDPTAFNITSGTESLFLHEAIPGHHYQISLQQENESLPKFRRFGWHGAYGEGWALYCESLGKEFGLYNDPYQYLGALSDEMLRAVRLVVDVGIHSRGLSREKAVDYMLENLPISKADAIAAIERYMAIPAQALSYKIGALKIKSLRSKYEQELGNKFKLSNFHDEFLKDGCLPLSILETKMESWKEKQK